jgi:hypothetical protein
MRTLLALLPLRFGEVCWRWIEKADGAEEAPTRSFVYFSAVSPFTFENIMQAVRAEITKHLIDLLPAAQS